MLVLTRKEDGTIHIGENIVIHVIHTAKGSVKLGIEAPQEVRIVRGELLAFVTQKEGATEQAVEGNDETSLPLNGPLRPFLAAS